jgi:hypothetical protein
VAYAAISAAKAMQIPFAVHDRSFSMNKFITVFDDSLHAIRYWSTQAQAHWNDSADSAERKFEIATNWFDERLKGQKQGWFSFTTEQTDALPDGFDPEKTNIVLFNSSEFETVGMDDYRLPFYDDQNSGIERLTRDLQADPNVMLYLRVHPNLKDRDNNQTRYIRDRLTAQFPNLQVIPADSPVSTYNLMKNATAVITYGSTTGVEAAFQKIPSILIAPSWYKVFDFCYTPETHEELVDSILQRKFLLGDAEAERRKSNSMKYAYFMATYGKPFHYFEQIDIFEIREKSKGPISYTAPPYEQGVKKELGARVELADGVRPNPLSGLVRELAQSVEELHAQNDQLQAQLNEVQRNLATRPGRIASSVHKISSLGRSFKRRLKKLL